MSLRERTELELFTPRARPNPISSRSITTPEQLAGIQRNPAEARDNQQCGAYGSARSGRLLKPIQKSVQRFVPADGYRCVTQSASVVPLNTEAADGLDAAYREHFAPMMKVAYLMTGSNAVAEDIVHDTFLRCAPMLDQLDNVGGYLRTAVVNACRTDWHRRRRTETLTADAVADPQPDPQDAGLRDALLAMSSRRRAAVVLRFYEDLSHQQIAEVLECRVATARSLVHRGLADLRGALQ